MSVLSIVVAGGHSAGHIEPAMAVADAITELAADARITALGTERGLDTRLIPARGYDLELIPPVPLPRRLNGALLRLPLRLASAIKSTTDVLDRVNADVVVGFGGYVALPAYLAARRRHIPIVIHEANAHPGVANRLGALLTRNVFTASADVRLLHSTPIGIPLRRTITHLDRAARRDRARSGFGLDAELPTLLVTGGSQGAQSINQVVADCRELFSAAGVQVLHIVGPANPIEAPVEPAGPPYVAVGFLDAMDDAYAAVDFVLCRAGAMTCAELAAVGLPAAYVPLPLRGGEQRHNAEAIVRAGGGLLVANDELNPEWIRTRLLPCLIDPVRLTAMSAAAARAGSRDADIVLAERVLRVAGEHHAQRKLKSRAGRGNR